MTEEHVAVRVSIYIPAEMLEEMRAEARRLDRNLGWLARRAWPIARAQIRRMPSATKKKGGSP